MWLSFQLSTSLVQSHPTAEPCLLYNISLRLSKPISDEQNTRGRKICAPEDTPRGFGILTSKDIPRVGIHFRILSVGFLFLMHEGFVTLDFVSFVPCLIQITFI